MSQNRPQPDADEPVEALLRSHLSAELDPHVGSARAAFERAVAEERARAAFWRRGLYVAGSLAAAAVVAVGIWITWPDGSSPVTGLADGQSTSQPNPHGGLTSVQWSPTDVTRQQAWRTEEAGTVLINGQPARAVYREKWQTTEFRDPDGFEVQINVPRRDVVFVDLPTQ